MKPYAESCDQNKEPIYLVIKEYLQDIKSVLEIGSGTGQHAVYFAGKFPHLQWHTSDLKVNHSGIKAWLDDASLNNVSQPLSIDVNQADWSVENVDAVFSANAIHIMDWNSVKKMFVGVGQLLEQGGFFILYGPFNYNASFTSESNARFDIWLKSRDPKSGIRDFEKVDSLANHCDLFLSHDYAMPSNNRILVWQKHAKI